MTRSFLAGDSPVVDCPSSTLVTWQTHTNKNRQQTVHHNTECVSLCSWNFHLPRCWTSVQSYIRWRRSRILVLLVSLCLSWRGTSHPPAIEKRRQDSMRKCHSILGGRRQNRLTENFSYTSLGWVNEVSTMSPVSSRTWTAARPWLVAVGLGRYFLTTVATM
jgi:hypothetical protein